MTDVLADFNFREPAPQEAIAALEEKYGAAIPADYLEFLARSNGGVGPVGEFGYVDLFRVEDLERLTAQYEIPEFAPGRLLFGSSGGGELFAFEVNAEAPRLTALPVPVEVEYATFVGDSLAQFLEVQSREQ